MFHDRGKHCRYEDSYMNNFAKYRRESLRLKDYDYSREGTYFVTICSTGRRPSFGLYPVLAAIVSNQLEDLPRRFPDFIVGDSVVMPNHIHFVIGKNPTQTPTTLGNVVGAYKSLCAVEWLKRIKQNNLPIKASLWQKHYYEHIIRDEDEFERIREYIANNPANWEFDSENRERTVSKAYVREWDWLENGRLASPKP